MDICFAFSCTPSSILHHCSTLSSNLAPNRGFCPSKRLQSLALQQDNTVTLALIAHAPGRQAWGHWTEQHPAEAIDTLFAMDISGIIQSYDSRSTSAALARTIMTPQYGHSQPYTGITSNTLIASDQHIPQNPFGFRGYSIATPNPVVPAFANINYIQQRPLPRLVQHGADGGRGVSYARNDRFVEERQSRSPSIKKEPQWNGPTGSPTFTSPTTKPLPSPLPNDVTEVDFGTDVDTLMKAIQAKSSTGPPQQSSPLTQSRPVVGTQFTPPYVQTGSQVGMQTGEQVEFKLTHEDLQDEASSPKGAKKRYICTIKGCSRSFYQKTHLDIHIRKHTGDKPYVSILVHLETSVELTI